MTVLALSARPARAAAGLAAPLPRPSDAGISLLNLAARQRMLSQRVVLQILLAAQGQRAQLEAAQRTLALFGESQCTLVDTPRRLEGSDAEHIRQTYQGARGVGPIIDDFIALAHATLALIADDSPQSARELAALVGRTDQVLDALNTATLAFDHISRTRADAMMRELTRIVSSIQTVAREAKVVSFNAQVMAARAGQHGREFAVVASVLSDITGQINGLSLQAVSLAGRARATD